MKKITLAMMSLLVLGAFTTVNAETNTVISPQSSIIKTTQDNKCPYGNNPQHCYLRQNKNRISQERNNVCPYGNVPQQQRKQDGKGPHHNKEHKQSHKHQHRHQITE